MIVKITAVKEENKNFLRVSGDVDGAATEVFVKASVLLGLTADQARNYLASELAQAKPAVAPDLAAIVGQVSI